MNVKEPAVFKVVWKTKYAKKFPWMSKLFAFWLSYVYQSNNHNMHVTRKRFFYPFFHSDTRWATLSCPLWLP